MKNEELNKVMSEFAFGKKTRLTFLGAMLFAGCIFFCGFIVGVIFF